MKPSVRAHRDCARMLEDEQDDVEEEEEDCSDCQGTGQRWDGLEDCETCGGTGKVEKW